MIVPPNSRDEEIVCVPDRLTAKRIAQAVSAALEGHGSPIDLAVELKAREWSAMLTDGVWLVTGNPKAFGRALHLYIKRTSGCIVRVETK